MTHTTHTAITSMAPKQLERARLGTNTLKGRAPKIAWVLLCVALAICAFGLEMDRQSRQDVRFAGLTPKPFRAFAQTAIAEGLLSAEDGAHAVPAAMRAIRREPMAAEPIALLARAQYLAKNEAAAEQPLIVAAGRGWRDAFTQKVMASAAVSTGEYEIAASRLLGFLASRKAGTGMDDPIVRSMLAHPQVRAAFGKQLASMPLLPLAFTMHGAANVSPDVYADVLLAYRAAGGTANCNVISRHAGKLLAGGELAPAMRLWNGVCGASAKGKSPDDLAFDPLPGDPLDGPLAWTYPGAGGLVVDEDRYGDATLLSYRNRSSVPQTIAEKLVILGVGEHRIAPGSHASGRAPLLKVRCLGVKASLQGPGSFDLADGPARFTIPADCAVQALTLSAPAMSEADGIALQLD